MADGNTTVYDASLGTKFTDGCYDPYDNKLYMTAIWSETYGIMKYDPALPFSSAGSWAFSDLTDFQVGATGYHGGVATGTHVYFAPRQDSSGTAHGIVARYNKGTFDDTGSWEFVNLATLISANHKGYAGAAFDGRYVYLIPENNGSAHGLAVRYDTHGAFDSAVSWASIDLAGIDAACVGYNGGLFDGRYVYYCPRTGAAAHGNALRYDTTKAFVTANFEWFDMTGKNANAKGYVGCAFDGRYVYYAPINNGAYHGLTIRYDTQGVFTSAAAWEVFDVTGISSALEGFFGCAFDGKYVYYAPFNNGAYHGNVLRYDIGLPFAAAASWSVMDLGAKNEDNVGYAGALTDGHRVYLVPYENTSAGHSNAVVISTKAGRSSTRLRGWNTSGKTAIESSTPLTRMVDQYTAHVTRHSGAVDSSLAAYALQVDNYGTLYAGVGHFPALRDGACIMAVDLFNGIEGIAFQYEILEQGICDLHLYNGKVYSPGVDEVEGSAYGNYYIGDRGVWTKKQVVTSAAHIFGACHDNLGRLYLAGSVGAGIPNGDYMWDTENEGLTVNEHNTTVAGYRCFSVLALSSTDIYVTGNTAANETSGVLIYTDTPGTYETRVGTIVPACRARLVQFGTHAICVDGGLDSLWQLIGGVAVEFALPFTIPSPTILSYSGYSLYNPMCAHGEHLYVLGTTGVWRSPDLVQWEKVLDLTGTYVALTVWQNRIILADIGLRPRLHMTRPV